MGNLTDLVDVLSSQGWELKAISVCLSIRATVAGSPAKKPFGVKRTDCNGMQEPGTPIINPFIKGPINLNDKGDAIIYTEDLSNSTTVMTVQYNYRIDRSQP